jgi:UDP-glucose 4-epimerase
VFGNGCGFSVAEVVRTAEKVTGRPVKAEMCPRRAGDPPVLVSDSSKARELLGWEPSYPELDKQIAHSWTWFRDKMPNL